MATKKYEAGGMTDTETCGKPGKPRCRQKFKSKGKSKETKGSILGTLGAIAGGIGAYGAYKKLKKEQKGGVTKYQGGGSTQSKKMVDLAKRGAGPVPVKTTDGSTKWSKDTKDPKGKKYQMGGIKKPLRKAQDGEPVYSGPFTEAQTKRMDKAYPSTVTPKGSNPWYNTKTYLNSGFNVGEDPVGAEKEERGSHEQFLRKINKLKKGGAMKKMKTGGMVNPNANLQATKSAGSKGVKPGVNPKAAASKVARGRSGGTSTAPKTATPRAKYGMSVKRK